MALVYFVIMSTFALAIGLIVGNILHPGTGLHLNPADAKKRAEISHRRGGPGRLLLGIIPKTFVSAFTEGQGTADAADRAARRVRRAAARPTGRPDPARDEHIQRLVFRVLAMIMWAAPIGAVRRHRPPWSARRLGGAEEPRDHHDRLLPDLPGVRLRRPRRGPVARRQGQHPEAVPYLGREFC